jgi:hypothetical protein
MDKFPSRADTCAPSPVVGVAGAARSSGSPDFEQRCGVAGRLRGGLNLPPLPVPLSPSFGVSVCVWFGQGLGHYNSSRLRLMRIKLVCLTMGNPCHSHLMRSLSLSRGSRALPVSGRERKAPLTGEVTAR